MEFYPHELDAHPDKLRIQATIDKVVRRYRLKVLDMLDTVDGEYRFVISDIYAVLEAED